MLKLPFDRLLTHHEALGLMHSVVSVTLVELSGPDEGTFSIGLNLAGRSEPTFISTQRDSTAARTWAKADTALRYLKQSLGFTGPIAVQLVPSTNRPHTG